LEHTEFSTVSFMVDSGGGPLGRTEGEPQRGCPRLRWRQGTASASSEGDFQQERSHHASASGAGTYCWGLRSNTDPRSAGPSSEEERGHRPGGPGRPPSRPATQWQTTGVLTAAMIVYALGAGITAAAGTRLALQLILITVFGLHPFQVPLANRASRIAAVRRCLTGVFLHWAICVPAAHLGSGSRFSGSLSGIEP